MNKKFFTAIFLFMVTASIFALKVPKLQGRVNDHAGLMSLNDKAAVEKYLEDLETTTSIQIAVLTVPSLEDENLEDYTIRVCEEWKLGQKDKDNGALLFVAFKEKKIRIEVGYGLEEKLTATKCGIIIRNIIKPQFMMGKYSDGLVEAAQTMGGIASDNAELISKKMEKRSSDGVSNALKGIVIMFLWFVFCSCLASGKKNHFLPWIIFSSAYRSSHRGTSDRIFRGPDHFGGSGGSGGGEGGGSGGGEQGGGEAPTTP